MRGGTTENLNMVARRAHIPRRGYGWRVVARCDRLRADWSCVGVRRAARDRRRARAVSRRSLLKRKKLGYDSAAGVKGETKGYHTSQCGGDRSKFTWVRQPRRTVKSDHQWPRVGT